MARPVLDPQTLRTLVGLGFMPERTGELLEASLPFQGMSRVGIQDEVNAMEQATDPATKERLRLLRGLLSQSDEEPVIDDSPAQAPGFGGYNPFSNVERGAF